jgi:hypothetical protein
MSPKVIRFALDGMFNESQEVFMARVAEVLSRVGDEHIEAVVNGVVEDVNIISEDVLKEYYSNKEKEDFLITKILARPASTPDAFEIVYDYCYSAYKRDENDSDWNSSTTPDEKRKFKFTRKSTCTNVYHLGSVPYVVAQSVDVTVI